MLLRVVAAVGADGVVVDGMVADVVPDGRGDAGVTSVLDEELDAGGVGVSAPPDAVIHASTMTTPATTRVG
jgi:hypothetical protein